ncbi:MAG: hypothetical protein KatS3mg008_1731 [Acidimicrobiales bacterium]|nr:MAG: hypothetical protein KatS3mg008_1731 [Acidimicrobiales bacterium]
MQSRHETPRVEMQTTVAEPQPRPPGKPPVWTRPRLVQLLAGPGWMASVVIALVAGGLGGVLPVGVLGEPGQGLAAGLFNGWVASAVLGPLWIPPLVTTLSCTELETGASAYRWASGFDAAALRRRRRIEAVGAVVCILAGCSVMGAFGAVLTNAFASGDWSVGLLGSPDLAELAFASLAAAVSLTFSITVSELSRRRLLALLTLEGSLVATCTFLAILYFAPVLEPLQVLSPWVGIWPLRAAEARSPLLATNLEGWIAALVTAVWMLAGVTAATLRRPDQLPGGS